ncbi:MAG TPA: DUF423 domain-containing protein [Thermoflexales bacterium]|nr:DUF423 domain-containing protein [Thermoflexales bacterium]HQW34626.1 DUF423 domain-containing protein [Thermoflexales bacterium]HQZ23477.1 DUF423 domain-containing protein [Thermoflexales bacterium]HQZ99347.1 DUF423 domain-containing protein [Thermoflexales bacterium]
MDRKFFAIGCALAALAVAAGAFGAHGLRGMIDESALANWETAARYQMYHAVGLMAVGYACAAFKRKLAGVAGWLFIVGIVLFSGSLYALSLSGLRILGAITPLGGVAFIAGWICLALAAMRKE